jgi:predicted AlkP superfamily pyrophosphatase or phosphodiesterase
VAAERAGIRTATMFWPGANVAWGGEMTKSWPNPLTGGERPQDWQQFNQQVTGIQRVNAVLDWMRRPAAIRPRLVTLYFDTVDTAGHQYGPDDPHTTQALADVDRLIGQLVDGLAALEQPANLVLVADHGMAQTSAERTVRLESIADPADYRVIESGPYAALAAVPGHDRALERRLLGRHAHAECWRKAEIPPRFAYGRNPRVPPYLCLADVGWLLVEKPPTTNRSSGGTHGYDNAAPEMAALFVAHGPAFSRGRTLPAFDNVAVYPLIRQLVGLPAASGTDGELTPLAAGLRR